MTRLRGISCLLSAAALVAAAESVPAQSGVPATSPMAQLGAGPIGASPASAATLFVLALEARRRGEAAVAADWLALVVQADPSALVPRLEWAGALLEAGRPAEVEPALAGVAPGVAGDSTGAAEVERLRAAAALRLGRTDAGIAGYEAAARYAPRDPGLRAQLIGLYRARGNETAALDHLRVVAELRPRNAELQLQIGRSLLDLRRWDEAERAFRAVLELTAGGEAAWDGLGLALAGQDRHVAAIEAFREGIAAAPGSSRLYEHLGDALLEDGRPEEALVAYRRADTLSPGRGELTDKIERARTARPQ